MPSFGEFTVAAHFFISFAGAARARPSERKAPTSIMALQPPSGQRGLSARGIILDAIDRLPGQLHVLGDLRDPDRRGANVALGDAETSSTM